MGSAAFVTYQGKLLLLLRDNNPNIGFPNHWSLLGGKIEEGETPDQALIRELKEEADIDVKEFKFLFERADHTGWIYHVELTDQDVQNLKLGDEGQELKFFEPSELKNITITPNIQLYITEYKNYLKGII